MNGTFRFYINETFRSIKVTLMTQTSPAPKLSKLHFALAMLLPVYPLITTILYVVLPLTEGWTIWQRTAVITPLMVFAITFVISPFVQKRFANFILRAA